MTATATLVENNITSRNIWEQCSQLKGQRRAHHKTEPFYSIQLKRRKKFTGNNKLKIRLDWQLKQKFLFFYFYISTSESRNPKKIGETQLTSENIQFIKLLSSSDGVISTTRVGTETLEAKPVAVTRPQNLSQKTSKIGRG